nr:transposase [Thermoanaerobacter siderophilus]
MEKEIKNFLTGEHPELNSSRSGYYQRDFETRYRKIENLSVPRIIKVNFIPNYLNHISAVRICLKKS